MRDVISTEALAEAGDLGITKRRRRGRKKTDEATGYTARMTTLDPDVEHTRARFVAWLRWHLVTRSKTRAALASRLGVTRSAVTQLLAPASKRSPSFEVLVSARRLIGYPLDVLLYCDPPRGPAHEV